MTVPRRAAVRARTAHGVLLDLGDGATCTLSLLAPDLAHVLFRRADGLRLPRTWTVPAHGAADVPWNGRPREDESSWPAPAPAVSETADEITLETTALRLAIRLAPFGLVWSLPGGAPFAADRVAEPYRLAASGRLRHAMARHPADRFYGLGDKTGPLDLAGRRLRLGMTDALGFDPEHGDPLYKHWPFLIVRDGASGVCYGMLYDNLAPGAVDLGCERDNYFGPYRLFEADDGDLDYYLFPGPSIGAVTRRFLALTGRPALPPRWTLGFAETAMAIADAPDAARRMEAFIDRARAEAIPLSAFHLGSGYTTIGPRRYVFHWNRDKYPDPPALMRRFHEAGLRVVANLKPCLLEDHPRYAEAAAAGAFVSDAGGAPAIAQFWDGEGAHIDFTAPAGIAWWQRGVREAILGVGIDAAWNDNNEYRIEDEAAAAAGFGAAFPLALARSLHALLMTRASREATLAAAPEARPFTVTRAGGPGIQRYAQTWSGDNLTGWESLRWNLRTGLQMGLSGLPNIGHDVGGFAGPVPDAELLVRWTQAGLLHPRFVMNSWKPDGIFTTPWLHPEVTALVRDAIRLRCRLIPYLYSLMHAASATGAPVLHPTFVAFPDDPRAWDENEEMMLGPSLLALPVTAPGLRARRAWLPAGPECWFDFHTGERLPAGADCVLAAPLDRLALLLPAGAILPMTGAADDFSHPTDEPSRLVRLAPGPGRGETEFVLVEDDGITASGPATRLTLRLVWSPSRIEFSIAPSGDFPLPYRTIAIALPPGEARPVSLSAPTDGPTPVLA